MEEKESKKSRTRVFIGSVISFSDRNLQKIQHPQEDALVLTLGIGKYDVKRVLVDPRSSVEVMYMEYFKKLGLKEADLQPASCPIVGFNGVLVWLVGVVSLPVTAGSVTEMINFLVITVASPYNVIMGRTWIHKMKATPSTYYQIIKFPTANRVKEIWGDQVEAKKCYSVAIL